MKLDVSSEKFSLKTPFRIAGSVRLVSNATVVVLEQDGHRGWGEAQGVWYQGETADSLLAQIEAVRPYIEAGIDRHELMELLPPGGARNAVDCALWDLECKKAGQSVWALSRTAAQDVTTVHTIGIEASIEATAQRAAELGGFSVIKLKLDGDQPVERVRAVRAELPGTDLIVDVNQGWRFEQLKAFAPELAACGVSMIEQPLPRGGDQELEGYQAPLPLCADESCLHLGEVALAAQRYQMINIKLDKTGGLTGALALADAALERGLDLMVGNMAGTSLAMAPSFVVAQKCRYVDLDGPLLLAGDRDPSMRFHHDGRLEAPPAELWG